MAIFAAILWVHGVSKILFRVSDFRSNLTNYCDSFGFCTYFVAVILSKISGKSQPQMQSLAVNEPSVKVVFCSTILQARRYQRFFFVRNVFFYLS